MVFRPRRSEREALVEADPGDLDEEVIASTNPRNTRKSYHVLVDGKAACGARSRSESEFKVITRRVAQRRWMYPCRECFVEVAECVEVGGEYQ